MHNTQWLNKYGWMELVEGSQKIVLNQMFSDHPVKYLSFQTRDCNVIWEVIKSCCTCERLWNFSSFWSKKERSSTLQGEGNYFISFKNARTPLSDFIYPNLSDFQFDHGMRATVL